MRTVLYIAALVLFLYVLVLLYIFFSIRKNLKWHANPSSEGKFADMNGRRIFYRVRGKGEPAVVVINAIGSASAEWWPIQNKVGSSFRMITFDRPGYNWSTPQDSPRSASSVCEDIQLILKFERIKKPVYLAANGTGAMYARYYAALFPQSVAGMLLLNPLPIRYGQWVQAVKENEDCRLPQEVLQKRRNLARKGLYRIFSPIRGYHLDKRFKNEIIEFYTRAENYDTAINELAGLESSIVQLNSPGEHFPPVPVRVLYPANESLIREWIKNGLPEYSARQLGRLHHDLSQDILSLSPRASVEEIEKSGEHLHLSKPDIVAERILKLLEEK